jgi:hypothetical protein
MSDIPKNEELFGLLDEFNREMDTCNWSPCIYLPQCVQLNRWIIECRRLSSCLITELDKPVKFSMVIHLSPTGVILPKPGVWQRSSAPGQKSNAIPADIQFLRLK